MILILILHSNKSNKQLAKVFFQTSLCKNSFVFLLRWDTSENNPSFSFQSFGFQSFCSLCFLLWISHHQLKNWNPIWGIGHLFYGLTSERSEALWLWEREMGSLGAILKHPDDFYPLLKLKMAARHAEKQIPPEPHWGFCYTMLHKVSRSFALVIQQLKPELRNAVSWRSSVLHLFCSFIILIFWRFFSWTNLFHFLSFWCWCWNPFISSDGFSLWTVWRIDRLFATLLGKKIDRCRIWYC